MEDYVAEITEELVADINVSAIEKFIQELPENALSLSIRIVLALIFLFFGLQVIKLVRRLLQESMKRIGADRGAMQFIDSFVKVALYVVLIIALASYFGVDAASVVALVGSAGVAIGLAVQGSLSNLAGGVLILLLKPFKAGDYIVDSNGKEGWVEEIHIFYTKLQTLDNKFIILPNGTLANNSIVNMTADDTRRYDLMVGISYDSDIRRAREAILEMLSGEEMVLQDREKLVYVDALADSCVKLGVRFWVQTEDYWNARWKVLEEIKYALENAGVKIPFPQMDVHVRQS